MMFDFLRLIEKHSTDIIVVRHTEGYYDYENGGVWVPGEEQRIEFRGAVLPLNKNQLQYNEGGAYTRKDRQVYVHVELAEGETIEHQGNKYTVAEKGDYADLASGLRVYFVRRVT